MNVEQRWNNELIRIARECIRILDSIVLPNNPIIVFDIDSTLLDFDFNVIKPIRNIYFYARMIGIKVSIITSRSGVKDIIDETIQSLNNVGIDEVECYYFRKPKITNPWSFKRNSRLNIQNRGYNIIMSLGDQDWDIYGEPCGISVKIPIIVGNNIIYITSPTEDDTVNASYDLSSSNPEGQ